ncbi:hypothetical protein Nepgr_028894 [Nepenthes gracilis]|uniref:NAB domain-containing protein n=1 Tax=Nepenthes gracilis TaxID=150966 RepID=A0AAD3TDW0_NEPGR|nr:hypothetical protein Nepgr_028894 [Nepenthes gracilis]
MDARSNLIEEDAHSIVKRGEMSSRKRTELLKLVGEILRAFSSLAGKYDDAMMELLQAHQATVEAFPSQVSFHFADETPSSSEPHTPCTQLPIHNVMV